MTIFYVDPVGGSTSANGQSFANRAKWVRNLSGVYPINGDEIRVIGNPITSVGNGAVRKMYGVDSYSGENCTITTYSDGSKTKLTKVLGRFKVGDIVQLANSNVTGDNNVNGFWRIDSLENPSNEATNQEWRIDHIATTAGTQSSIKIHDAPAFYLNSAVTQDIFAGEDTTFTNWTAVSGVTTEKKNQYWSSWTSDAWSGSSGQVQRITIPTNQATGLCAHYTLPSTLDLSSYQQISFRARSNGITQNNSSAHNASDIHFSLRLCTDTAGQTSVHTIPLDFRKCHRRYWQNLCVDLGTNLNSSIRSIAIYKDNSQPDTEDIGIANIIACKASSAADSLTHTSIIGLNTTDDPYWYKIKFISGKKVILDKPSEYGGDAALYSYYSGNPYVFFSECKSNVAIYKMQPFTIPKRYQTKDNSNVTLYDFPGDFGGSTDLMGGASHGGNTYPVKITGGWTASDGSATDMTHRTSLTCFDGETGKGYFRHTSNQLIENFAWINMHEGHRLNVSYFSGLRNIHCIGCTPNTWYGAPYFSNAKVFYFSEIFTVQSNSGIYANYFGKIKGNGFGNASRSSNQPADNGVSDFTNWHGIGNRQWGVNLDSGWSGDTASERIGTIGNIFCFGNNRHNFIDSQNSDKMADTIQLLKGGHIMAPWGFSRGMYYALNGEYGVTNITTLHCEAAYAAVQQDSNNGNLTIGTLTSIVPHTTNYDEDRPIRYYDSQMYRSIDHRKGKLTINGGTCDGNIWIYATAGDIKSVNLALAEAAHVTNPIGQQQGNGWYYAKNYDNVSGDNRSYYQANYIANETSTVNTAGGTAWKFISTLANTPLGFEACKVAVNASTEVTVTLYVYTSNSAAYGGLRIKANSLLGINSDVTAYDNTGNSGWVQITATCTPTAQGILNIELEAYTTDGNSSHTIIVDDLSVSQA